MKISWLVIMLSILYICPLGSITQIEVSIDQPHKNLNDFIITQNKNYSEKLAISLIKRERPTTYERLSEIKLQIKKKAEEDNIVEVSKLTFQYKKLLNTTQKDLATLNEKLDLQKIFKGQFTSLISVGLNSPKLAS